jgi:protocatechuate 3,4-dioxygenase beta subunit
LVRVCGIVADARARSKPFGAGDIVAEPLARCGEDDTMPIRDRSRRDVLRDCLAAGVLLVPTRWTEAEVLHAWFEAQTTRQPTAHVEMGPFYKRRAPVTTMLRATGDPGLPLTVTGRVINVHGEPVTGATIEVWQANDGGLYDLEGFRYRATIAPPPSGAYGFDSVLPGHYPARVARHVHYFVTAPGHRPLSTQLYFATDEVFEGNPDANYRKDPLITSRTLVRPVTLTGTPGAAIAAVVFDLVVEKA